MSAVNDTEALFNDVGQVKKELEKYDVGKAVDVNEIYEMLETHSFRTDRVQFVTTHFLVTLGLVTDFGNEDTINVSDNDDDYLDIFCPSTPEDSECDDTVVLDLTIPDIHSNSGIGYPETLGAAEIDVYPSTSLFQNEAESTSQVHEIEPAASAGTSASNCERNVVISTTVESANTKHNSERSNGNVLPPPTHQNDDFMCDVNNNDPNNNTDYELPAQVEAKGEEPYFAVTDSDDSEMEFEDEDDVRRKLLEEARLIRSIVREQSLEQIYSYLEANVNCKSRVRIVMKEFLRMDMEPEFCDSAVSDNGSVGCKPEVPSQHGVSETQNLSEPQPCTSTGREIETGKWRVVKSNIPPKPRPRASSNTEMKMRPLEQNAAREFCPSRPKNAKMNTEGSTSDKQKGMKFQKGKVSKSHQSVEKSCKKVHDAIEAFKITEPGTAADPKLPSIWELSSTTASGASAEQNSGALGNPGEAGSTSATNFNEQTKPADANNASTLKTDTFISVRHTWNERKEMCAAKARPVDSPIPSSSTTSSAGQRLKRKMESIDSESSLNKNKIGDFDQSHSLPHTDIATNKTALTQVQLKYKSVLMEMFPDADPQYLREQCQTVETEESMLNMVTKLLDKNKYPHRQTPEEVAIEVGTEPSTSLSSLDKERIEMQYDTLVAILPNADPLYLRATCERIGNDEDDMKDFVTHALETKMYPTREDYLKRQEVLALQKKYTEQFSIEGFLEIIPDPFKYFLEEKKNDRKLTEYALSYLKGRYRKILDITLRRAFFSNRYNLTLTCQELDNYKGNLRIHRRSDYECRIPPEVNIPFLQEVSSSFTLFKLREQIVTNEHRIVLCSCESSVVLSVMLCRLVVHQCFRVT
jgi:hypothetical protein